VGETQLSLPLIPGVDFVGSIERIDKRTASRFGLGIGDRVTALVKHGGNARYTKIGAEQLVKVPDDVNPLRGGMSCRGISLCLPSYPLWPTTTHAIQEDSPNRKIDSCTWRPD
jgi:hypothetical protein